MPAQMFLQTGGIFITLCPGFVVTSYHLQTWTLSLEIHRGCKVVNSVRSVLSHAHLHKHVSSNYWHFHNFVHTPCRPEPYMYLHALCGARTSWPSDGMLAHIRHTHGVSLQYGSVGVPSASPMCCMACCRRHRQKAFPQCAQSSEHLTSIEW